MAAKYNGKTGDEWRAVADDYYYWYKKTGDEWYLTEYRQATLKASIADGLDDDDSGSGGSSETYSMSIHYNNSRKSFGGTSGDDSIINYGDYITLDAGAGNDSIKNAAFLDNLRRRRK